MKRAGSLKYAALLLLTTFFSAGCSDGVQKPVKVRSSEHGVVKVLGYAGENVLTCTGSPLKGTREVVTAAHCLAGVTAVTIKSTSGTWYGTAVRTQPTLDIAVVEVATPLEFGYSRTPETGTVPAKAVGFDTGTVLKECSITFNTSSPESVFPCGLLPGASGGPVLSADNILGVVIEYAANHSNVAVPLPEALDGEGWVRTEL